ncbi:MAG TPA: hypothetical protein VHE10_01560 [Candidatus Paceibacterota bacterium]|nr:hypothetical protein [Candidatus Paceibacterota bacterium]
MKRQKLVEYHAKFQIGGLINPRLGGPYGFVSHLIKPGEDYFEIISREIDFVAPRPFASLDLEEKGRWTLDEPSKELFSGELEPAYMKHTCFAPKFVSDGSMFMLIGDQEFGQVCHAQRMDAHFTAIKSDVSVTELLKTIRDLYAGRCRGEFGTHWFNIPVRDWRLKLVIKRSWKAANPDKSSYEIFVPPVEWIKEHAAFATKYATTSS